MTVAQADKMVAQRAAAAKERAALQQQIDEKRQHALAERRQQIELEQRNEQIQNDMEMERLQRENAERLGRLKQLTELEEIASRQLDEANKQIASLSEMIGNNNTTVNLSVGSEIRTMETDVITDNNNHQPSVQSDLHRNRLHNLASSIFFDDNLGTQSTLPNITVMDNNSNMIDVDNGNWTAGASNTVACSLLTKNRTENVLPAAEAEHGEMRHSLSLQLSTTSDHSDKHTLTTPMSTTSDPFEPSDGHSGSKNDHDDSDDEFMSAYGSSVHRSEQNHQDSNNNAPPSESSASSSLPILNRSTSAAATDSVNGARLNHFIIKSLALPSSIGLPEKANNRNNQNVVSSVKLFNTTDTSADDAKKYSCNNLSNLNVTNLTTFLHKSFAIPLNAYFNVVNNEVLRMFLCDLNVFAHFHSLRNYFSMMDSEFANAIFSGLMDKLETVRYPHELINSSVLHSILATAMHSNMASIDKNVDGISFAITNVPNEWNHESPDVFGAIMLTYQAEWPLNLVVNHEAIEHYGYIFGHLLKIKRVTYALDQAFFVSAY